MFVERKANCRKFVLDPSLFNTHHRKFSNNDLSALLSKHDIELALEVIDSEETDTNKPVLVLIHGNSTSKHFFANQIRYYSVCYRVIVFDLLGHGNSTKVRDHQNLSEEDTYDLSEALYSIPTMVEAIKQLLQKKNVVKAHFIGWSLGGHIAYAIAIDNPNLVSSIITIGSPPVLFSSEGIKKGFTPWFVNTLIPDWINKPQVFSFEDAEELAICMGITNIDFEWVIDMTISDPQMRKHLFNKIDLFNQNTKSLLDAEYFVSITSLPVCLIVGGNDCGINVDYIKSFDKKLLHPHSNINIIHQAPHAVLQSHPEICHQIIDDFLGGKAQHPRPAAT